MLLIIIIDCISEGTIVYNLVMYASMYQSGVAAQFAYEEVVWGHSYTKLVLSQLQLQRLIITYFYLMNLIMIHEYRYRSNMEGISKQKIFFLLFLMSPVHPHLNFFFLLDKRINLCHKHSKTSLLWLTCLHLLNY